MEWAFTVIATATMVGILGMSIERFVIIHKTFGNETLLNETQGGAWSATSNESGNGDQVDCSHWSCLNDFTFAVLILINWRKH